MPGPPCPGTRLKTSAGLSPAGPKPAAAVGEVTVEAKCPQAGRLGHSGPGSADPWLSADVPGGLLSQVVRALGGGQGCWPVRMSSGW